MHNGSFDLDILNKIVGELVYKNIWMVQVDVFDETYEENVCFNVTFEIRRVRSRS